MIGSTKQPLSRSAVTQNVTTFDNVFHQRRGRQKKIVQSLPFAFILAGVGISIVAQVPPLEEKRDD